MKVVATVDNISRHLSAQRPTKVQTQNVDEPRSLKD